MLGVKKISQYALFNAKRTARLQEDPDTALTEGDVLALDDTHAPHPASRKRECP